MRVKDKVRSADGVGTIVSVEFPHSSCKRFVVRYKKLPKGFTKKQFPDNELSYFPEELKVVK
jgi:hypothetical protein